MDKKTEKAIKRLQNNFPLLGPWLRRKAAEALTGIDEPRAVAALVDALHDQNQKVKTAADTALKTLKNAARDHFCSLWAEKRDRGLEAIIIERRYRAVQPLRLNYLTSLKLGEVAAPAKADAEGVKILFELEKDTDGGIANNARGCLRSLTNPNGIDYFCSLWAEKRDRGLEAIIIERRYRAVQPLRLNYLTSLKLGEVAAPAKADAEGVKILFDLEKDTDGVIANNARGCLRSLINQNGIDYFCSLWAEKRSEELKGIMFACGYIAAQPSLLSALTTFVQGKKLQTQLLEQDFNVCFLDPDDTVVTGAVEYYSDMKGNNALPALWDFVKAHPASAVLRVLHQKKWRPEEPSERALFYFLAGELALYHDLDFEQSHIRYWYETGEPALKEAIAARIRKSGDTRLLAVFRSARGSRKKAFSDKETDLQIEILVKKKNFQELFHLLPHATYEQGLRIITSMQQAGWKHPDSHSRALQERLEKFIGEKEDKNKSPVSYAMVMYQDFRPMLTGSEKPPQDDAGLRAWLHDSDNFRRRSAALVTLAEKGSAQLGDAANSASADPYWQVRMAAAAAELIRPGSLSPANKALLQDDHVYWVQALLKLPRERRLTELGPGGLEQMSEIGKGSDPSRKPEVADTFFDLIKGFIPTAEKKYLLTLGEFLGTEVAVSEEAAYAAGDKDVEIEVEE